MSREINQFMAQKRATFKKIKELKQQFLDETYGPNVPKRSKKHFEKWIDQVTILLDNHKHFIKWKTEKCQQENNFPRNFNNVYDQQHDLELLLSTIYRGMWQRNWTHQDFQQAKLISMNID